MTKLSFERTDSDGIIGAGRLTLDNVVFDTPNSFPILRTSQDPNELDLLIGEKGKFLLEHISGAMIRLYDVPTIIEPHTRRLALEELHPQLTIDGKVSRSPYGTFYNDNLPLSDPCLEYTSIMVADIDRRFRRFAAVPGIQNFFVQFERNRKALQNPDTEKVRALRKTMHNSLWFGSSRDERRDRSDMLTDLTRYQLQHFRMAIPGAHLIETPNDVRNNIEINEYCQGLAYQAKKDSATYLPFHRKAIKKDEVMGASLDYLRKNKQSKLNIIKFKDLDLHCPVDYKARKAFKHFLAEINDIKEEQPDRAFMLLEAGTQYYVSMQVFDIVSTSLTGFDRDVTGGHREEGIRYAPLWYDENKMWPRPTDDTPKPDPEHCYVCAETQHFNFNDSTIARKRRIHRLNDLNKDAKAIREAVSAKDGARVMRTRVAFAEFSYARDLILSP